MPAIPTDEESLLRAVNALAQFGTKTGAAAALSLNLSTLTHRLREAGRQGIVATIDKRPTVAFERDVLPDPELPIEDLLDLREKAFLRKDKAEIARKLIEVRIKLDGPIGICHFGDPHVDDDGCDIPSLRKHIRIVNETPGMFAANVGDLQNNWVGRIAHLWAQQSTSATQAWRLTEWLVNACPWLYLIGGNHDAWSGNGDPLNWITRTQQGVFEYDGVRLALKFPNGKIIRINARHDFTGHSMWNPTHGPLKAAMMGWRDHMLTCGHTHVSGYQLAKDPSSGLISHILRVAGFKKHDRYAKQKGFPDAAFTPASTTIIDPSKADNDPGLITVIHDVEMAAKFLTHLRKGFDLQSGKVGQRKRAA
jgi:hypothetical protein